MKKSVSKSLLCLLAAASVNGLAACATLMGEETSSRGPASEYDRGYEPTENTTAPEEAHGVPRMRPTASNEDSRTEDAVHARDVVIGMTRSQVMASWGEPYARDIAGDGSGGHERWHYGSRASLNGERIVIFEEGRVAGWYR